MTTMSGRWCITRGSGQRPGRAHGRLFGTSAWYNPVTGLTEIHA
jgi:hypothetical protein